MEISYNDIIKQLEAYYKKRKGVITYRGLEYSTEFAEDVKDVGKEFYIDPMLPIDLLTVERKEEIDDKTNELKPVSYYTLHWLISKDDPELERKLQFYRFYLSRISKLKGVQIIMVIPGSSEKKLEKPLRKIAKENGFGLWRVEASQEKPEELCKSQDFREHMEEAFRNPPIGMRHFRKPIKDKAGEITLFFDRYVGEAVDALAGRTPKQAGKRYIERKLLDLVFELKNISYTKKLRELVTQHLEQKGNDYDFVSNTFSTLWSECELGADYTDFLRVSELPLYNIFATQGKLYRDHYLHQFQVFLLGLYIIDNLPQKFGGSIDKQWLITSSFHDMAYPIELYDIWARRFFEQSLGVPEMGVLDIKSYFVDRSLLSRLGFLVNALCKTHFNDELQGNWLHKEKDLVTFLHKKIVETKHHCILGSLYLLKHAQSCSSDLLYNLFVPSALAIALHHDVLRQKDDDEWQKLPDNRKLQSLKFTNDQLAFLLMFCDCAQEWGRPTGKQPTQGNEEEDAKRFIFSKCDVTATGCSVVIKTPFLSVNDKRFEVKDNELRILEKFLESPQDVEFKITLVDRSGATRDYPMRGPGQES